ncbi:hypothetical protein [Thauera sp. 2A1]|uniref:hypothetical protein n=1 Tax=Thauera sp. 2A1 TaxID=2570191 RepID=UPI00210C5899|nr:hypothetical protein [Thauera sp. 2A1]KAI5914842.1 hypothetical protein GH664_10095 [Thauera sp. 2A1]
MDQADLIAESRRASKRAVEAAAQPCVFAFGKALMQAESQKTKTATRAVLVMKIWGDIPESNR